MSELKLKSLRCPRCGGAADAPTWLDQALRRNLETGSVAVECPRCRVELHLRVEPNRAAVGSLSESRPRMFRPEATIEQPGLEIRRKPDSICVRWQRREWWFEPG